MKRVVGFILVAAIIVAASLLTGQSTLSIAEKPITSDEQIESWITQLAEENGWEDWTKSSWKKYPLGPGQHGWVVLLEHEHEETGYLVVYVNPHPTEEPRLHLGEYGEGAYPLFSIQTLYRTMVQHELISDTYSYEQIEEWAEAQTKSYVGPLQAVWEIEWEGEVHIFDAITGESFPLENEWEQDALPLEFQEGMFVQTEMALKKEHQLEAFDPYERWVWLVEDAFHFTFFDDIRAIIELDYEVSWVSQLFGQWITIPFAVTGYHQWANDTEMAAYIRLDHYGSQRFIPLNTLQQFGEFYVEL